MGSIWDSAHGLGPPAVLTLGVAVVVLTGMLIHCFVGAAVWRRTIWRVTLGTILALLAMEFLGVAPGLALLGRQLAARPASPPASHSPLPRDTAAFTPALADEQPAVSYAIRQPLQPWQPSSNAANAVVASPQLRKPQPREQSAVRVSSVEQPVTAQAPAARWPALILAAGALIWAAGAVVCLGWIAWGRICLAGLGRRQRDGGDAELLRRIDRLRVRLGLGRPVRVWHGRRLTAPVAFGLWRPTVVLPVGFADEFDALQQETMLAHELAHLAAGDPAWRLAADLLAAGLWWHPAVHFARRQLDIVSEQAADEASLLVPDGPNILADCLVQLGRRLTAPGRLGWLGIGGSGFRSALGRRVQRLLELNENRPALGGPMGNALAKLVFPVVLVVVALSCTVWARPRTPSLQGETTMNVLTSSMRQSLAAVVLTTILGPLGGEATGDDAPAPAAEAADPVDAGLLAQHGDIQRRIREFRGREHPEIVRDREHAEREQHLRSLHRQREELEGQVEMLQRELAEVKEDAKRELSGMEKERNRLRNRLREEHEELEEQAENIERELRELLEDEDEDDDDEDEDEEALIAELKEKLEGIARQRRKLEQRARNIHWESTRFRQAREMAAEGVEVELRKARQRLERLRQEIAEDGGERPHLHLPRPEPGQEMDMRMRHLHEAIEHLREGGFHEQAEALARQVDRPAHEHPEPGPPAGPEMVQEMRDEIKRLRRDMDQLREMVRELIERR